MRIQKINLNADVPFVIGRGRYVRLLEAIEPVRIETQTLNEKSNQNGDLLANVGGEFFPFERATLISNIAQTVVIAYSELPIFDNRLGVNGALISEVVSKGAASVAIKNVALAAGRVEVLAGDVRRRTALINTSDEVTFYADATGGTGFVVDGVLEHECQGALYAEGAGTVSVMEYLN